MHTRFQGIKAVGRCKSVVVTPALALAAYAKRVAEIGSLIPDSKWPRY